MLLILRAHGARAAIAGDLAESLRFKRLSVDAGEKAGDYRNACVERVNVGNCFTEIGDHEGAEVEVREALTAAERMGLIFVVAFASTTSAGRWRGAAPSPRASRSSARRSTCSRARTTRGWSRRRAPYLSFMLTQSGDGEQAEREAEVALAIVSGEIDTLYALSARADARLARGAVADALADAARAVEKLDELGGIDEGEAIVRLVHARALHASGRFEEARAAIGRAEAHVRETASKESTTPRCASAASGWSPRTPRRSSSRASGSAAASRRRDRPELELEADLGVAARSLEARLAEGLDHAVGGVLGLLVRERDAGARDATFGREVRGRGELAVEAALALLSLGAGAGDVAAHASLLGEIGGRLRRVDRVRLFGEALAADRERPRPGARALEDAFLDVAVAERRRAHVGPARRALAIDAEAKLDVAAEHVELGRALDAALDVDAQRGEGLVHRLFVEAANLGLHRGERVDLLGDGDRLAGGDSGGRRLGGATNQRDDGEERRGPRRGDAHAEAFSKT